MISDISSLEKSPEEYDVCIIGSGPAGLSVALTLAETNLRVCMLESGGFHKEKNIQNMYRGESVGIPLPNGMANSRSRYFGVSSNCWAGACTKLDRIDFLHREWVPHSGWPISYDEVYKYEGDAQRILLCGDYNLTDALDSLKIELNLKNPNLELGYWRFSHTPLLGSFYKSFLDKSDVEVFLHADVTELMSNSNANHIEKVLVQTVSGKSFFIKSKFYICALGGIENARLLLASNRVQEMGLGNDCDMVGRFFSDHPFSVCASIEPSLTGRSFVDFFNIFNDPGPRHQNIRFNSLIKTNEHFQKSNKTLNSALFFASHDAEFSQGLMAAVRLRQALHERRIPDNLLEDFFEVGMDIFNVGKIAWRRYLGGGISNGRIALKVQAETVPNPSSRVTLSEKIDKYGKPLARLDWRLTSEDRKATDFLLAEIEKELAANNFGSIKMDAWLEDESRIIPQDVRGGSHHSGTTRMSESPASGVVDSNCKVHGVDNLYIAGSSVFPTNGWANPTFTISTLSIRLAHHLKDRINTEMKLF